MLQFRGLACNCRGGAGGRACRTSQQLSAAPSASASVRPLLPSSAKAVQHTPKASPRPMRGGAAAVASLETSAPAPGHAHIPAELLDHARPYAVVDFGGNRHYVEEGSSVALSKSLLGEGVELGSTLTFSKVTALKAGGELMRGAPYLDECIVEGCLVDEFRGPSAPADPASSLVVGKVRITSIRKA